MTQLTKHFSLDEMIFSETAIRLGVNNAPGPAEMINLNRLAGFLEQVRAALGDRIIVINSAYRNSIINAAVGSAKTSQHILGCAADIRVPGMTPDEVVRTIRASGLQYDQLIREFDSWTHVSITSDPEGKPRRQTLIIDRSGTRPYS